MRLTINRQMTKILTVNRQKRNVFTVNRQMSKPILAVKYVSDILSKLIIIIIIIKELND